jgi:hypothetical protein
MLSDNVMAGTRRFKHHERTASVLFALHAGIATAIGFKSSKAECRFLRKSEGVTSECVKPGHAVFSPTSDLALSEKVKNSWPGF